MPLNCTLKMVKIIKFAVCIFYCNKKLQAKKGEMTKRNFFFPFIFISWRLITLQYCSGFRHTLTWVSHGFTCVTHPDPPSHLPPPSHPSGSSQCIQRGLEICFTLDNTHVSMLFSQIMTKRNLKDIWIKCDVWTSLVPNSNTPTLKNSFYKS